MDAGSDDKEELGDKDDINYKTIVNKNLTMEGSVKDGNFEVEGAINFDFDFYSSQPDHALIRASQIKLGPSSS